MQTEPTGHFTVDMAEELEALLREFAATAAANRETFAEGTWVNGFESGLAVAYKIAADAIRDWFAWGATS